MKSARHAMILELINANIIETQDELAESLRDNGFSVTQATVSRDIKELRLLKVLDDSGRYKYATVDKAETHFADRFMRMFSHSVISMSCAGNLIVIKTISGSANVAAEAIDSLRWPELAGTLAGDNTIFVAIKDIKAIPETIRKFQALMK